MATPPVSAVILAYQRRDAVAIVLDALRELPFDEVIVVDNASTDGTAEMVRGRTDARLVESGGNLGAAGRNVGVAAARNDLVVLLDDDAYPLPGAVEALATEFTRDPRLGVLGGYVLDVDADGAAQRGSGVGDFDWWLRGGRLASERTPDGGFPTFFFPEGACMVRKSAFLDAGGFLPAFFITVSELDLAARMLERDWDVRYQPSAVFHHFKEQVGRVGTSPVLRFRVRNQLWHFWLRYPLMGAIWRSLFYLAFDAIECFYRRSPRSLFGGIGDAVRGWSGVRGQRSVLPRRIRRRCELNRARLHAQLLAHMLRRKVGPSAAQD